MKKSFTLIEILISIFLLSLLFFAMNKIILYFTNTNKFIKKESKTDKNIFLKVLYYDLLNAKKVKIVKANNSNYIRLYLQTSNSLYNIPEPFVVWYVSKNKNSLMRIENTNPISIPNTNFIFIDKFANKIKIFNIYKYNNKFFVFIKHSKKPLFFEMIKGDY